MACNHLARFVFVRQEKRRMSPFQCSKVAAVIEDASLIAPELIDVEVLSVLRRAVMRQEISEQRALLAIEDLVDWSIDRITHKPLLWLAWQYRDNISAHDALYVAAARISMRLY